MALTLAVPAITKFQLRKPAKVALKPMKIPAISKTPKVTSLMAIIFASQVYQPASNINWMKPRFAPLRL